ncbi:thioesterase II family protein [Rhizobium leguminosarum]|uniref:thioesterase II family protein n=1 Tax=Rhizobium leguminosarum TaxID=384 RepID=UPI003F9CD544
MTISSWLLRRVQRDARIRLFCFPYAAGNPAAYLAWQEVLGPSVEVCAIQFPGRGRRLREANIDRLDPLVHRLAPVISSECNLPFSFFGHSLGALVAFELARFCKRMNIRQPEQIIVSGCEAPSMRTQDDALHLLDDEHLIAELREYNGTPAEILDHQEYMALALPSIRADFAIAETYEYRPGVRLDQPLHVLAGVGDRIVPSDRVPQWLNETTRPGSVHWFEGDHFFVDAQRDGVAILVKKLLASRGTK